MIQHNTLFKHLNRFNLFTEYLVEYLKIIIIVKILAFINSFEQNFF